MTRIKCCGMTRVDDAVLAAKLGADAVGVVIAASKRQVTLAQGRAILEALPPFVSTVALCMNNDAELVRAVIEQLRPNLLQFHGDESDEWCAQFNWPYLKAIAMGAGPSALQQLTQYPRAAGLLLDGHGLGEAGGSGKRFDWSLMPHDLRQPLILAGGLNPDNVAQAIGVARPWAVDVSSGIESTPGIKDPHRLSAFISAVRAVG